MRGRPTTKCSVKKKKRKRFEKWGCKGIGIAAMMAPARQTITNLSEKEGDEEYRERGRQRETERKQEKKKKRPGERESEKEREYIYSHLL